MNKNFVAVSVIASITVLVIYFVNLYSIDLPKQQAKNDYWEQEAKYATENASLICPPSKEGKPIPPNSCKRQDHYSYDRQQQIADHKAQLHMRNMAVGGFILGVAGLILLWWTLNATQAAANSAAETLRLAKIATRIEHRAYVSLKRVAFGSQLDKKPALIPFSQIIESAKGNMPVCFEISNFGNVPSEKVTIFFRCKAIYLDKNCATQILPNCKFGDFEKLEIGHMGPKADIVNGRSHVWPVYGTPQDIEIFKKRNAAQVFVQTITITRDEYSRLADSPIKCIIQTWTSVCIANQELQQQKSENIEIPNLDGVEAVFTSLPDTANLCFGAPHIS